LKRVLITGGSGFVGNRLFSYLAKIGVDTRLLGRNEKIGYKTIICDLLSSKIPSNAANGIDTVFHLAGYSHDLHDASLVEDRYHKINVDATVQLAQLAVNSGVKRFVFVSSVKAGGTSVSGQPMTEEDQFEPEGIYGKTKREAELKLLKIGRKSKMHVAIVRSSLAYGPNVKGNLKLMLSGIEKGWFPPLPETGNRRSMIHVDDLVRALLLVAEDKRANGEIFIATDGSPYSSREIYEAMCAVLGKSAPQWSVPKSLFDIVATINPTLNYKVNKLMGNEYYSFEKLHRLGFKAKCTLKEMNETSI